MLKAVRVLFTQVRYHKHHSTPKHWAKDGKKYGLVTYYPRYPDHQDPPIQATKLFLVERVKTLRGCPYWEKDALKSIHLDSVKRHRHTTVVKNTPEMCALLWKIKHLIKVTPIEMPDNLPDAESVSTYVHENGTLMIFPPIDEKRYKATEEFRNNPKRLDGDTLQEKLRLKWVQGFDNSA